MGIFSVYCSCKYLFPLPNPRQHDSIQGKQLIASIFLIIAQSPWSI